MNNRTRLHSFLRTSAIAFFSLTFGLNLFPAVFQVAANSGPAAPALRFAPASPISPLASTAPAKTVLFDNSHAEDSGVSADWIIDTHQPTPSPSNPSVETDWTGGLSAWGVALAKGGYQVRTLPTSGRITYGDATNPQDLSNYRTFILPEPNSALTLAEKDAVIRFVSNGGGLFMISDHINSDRNNDGTDSPRILNDLMNNNSTANNVFGIQFDLLNIQTANLTNVGNTSDPVLTGPFGNARRSIIRNGTTMKLSPSINPSVHGLLYLDGVSNTGTSSVFVAAGSYGQGRVVGIADSSTMDDGTGQSGRNLHNGWNDPNADDAQLFLNATAWLAGESGGTTATPDFTLTVSPATLSVTAGNTTSFTVGTTNKNGFSGNLAISVTGASGGVTAAASPASIASGSSTTVYISSATTTPAGTQTLTVTATGGGVTHVATVALTVNPVSGGNQTVTYSASPGTAIPDNNTTGITSVINVPAGLSIQNLSVSVNITHTYRGDLQIDLVSPSGTVSRLKSSSNDSTANLVATYTPTSFAGQNSAGNWQLKIADVAAGDVGKLNSWSLTITGPPSTGGGTTGDFSLSLTKTDGTTGSTGNWTRGSTFARIVTVTGTGGFTGPVTLTYSVSQGGLFSSVTVSTNPVTPGSTSQMNFTVPSTAPTGSSTVTIIGTDASGRQRTATIALQVS